MVLASITILSIKIETMHITILGAGPAGLALGYYAQKNGFKFRIYEANNRAGGNCITINYKDFLFDLGPHRFHDKNQDITREITKLLNNKWQKINTPNQIYYQNKYINFPLSPLDLLKKNGPIDFLKSGFSFLKTRFFSKGYPESFEGLALHNYGNLIARKFLLNYSEKLWGLPCKNLSSQISGNRLKGLDLITLFTEAILGKVAEGHFYYPVNGYGDIVDKLANFCQEENIFLNSRITKVFHDFTRIEAIEIEDKNQVKVEEIVSTIPLNILIKSMEPSPPDEILSLAESLHYRNLRLVALFLNKELVTRNATVYFPEHKFPFTRIYEPKNRSSSMSPPGQTSLVAEIPCHYKDEIWSMTQEGIINLVKEKLIYIGWIKEEEIIDSWVGLINYAYPVLEIKFEDKIQKIMSWLDNFVNLNISGRNGKFLYTHLHDQMIFGQEIIEQYISKI